MPFIFLLADRSSRATTRLSARFQTLRARRRGGLVKLSLSRSLLPRPPFVFLTGAFSLVSFFRFGLATHCASCRAIFIASASPSLVISPPDYTPFFLLLIVELGHWTLLRRRICSHPPARTRMRNPTAGRGFCPNGDDPLSCLPPPP